MKSGVENRRKRVEERKPENGKKAEKGEAGNFFDTQNAGFTPVSGTFEGI